MNRYILYLDALGKRPRDESDKVTESSDESNNTTEAPFEIWAKDDKADWTSWRPKRSGPVACCNNYYDPDMIRVYPSYDKKQHKDFNMQNQFGERNTYFYIKNNNEHDVTLRVKYFWKEEGENEKVSERYEDNEYALIKLRPREMEAVAHCIGIGYPEEYCGYYLYDETNKSNTDYVVKITLLPEA